MIKTLSLPVATIAAIASIKDDTLRNRFLKVLETGTADPDSFRAADYDDTDPIIRDLVSRIARRIERSRRRAERKAKGENGRNTKPLSPNSTASKAPDGSYWHEYLLPATDDRLIITSGTQKVTLQLNDRNTRRFLWFNQNFATFCTNTISTLKSIEGFPELYDKLIKSFDHITSQISRLINPIARQVSQVMHMPRNSRPALLEYFQGDPCNWQK